MRFTLTHPLDTRPSLVVATCDNIDNAEIDRLRDEIFGLGCSNGLLFDEQRCLILRNTFSSEGLDSIQVVQELRTPEVLATVPPRSTSLYERVERWLELLSSEWAQALPRGPARARLIEEIVPAAAGSRIDSRDDRLS